MPNIAYETIVDGHELYLNVQGRVNAHERDKASAVKEVRKTHKMEEDEVDFSDLMEAATVNVEKGWTSQQVLDVMFELTGKTG